MNNIHYLTYPEIKELILNEPVKRTQALLAFQYASACRIGEILKYKHKTTDGQEYVTQGLLKSNITIKDNEIMWQIPNFKCKKKDRVNKIGFVLKDKEQWLWEIIHSWITTSQEQIFQLSESKARQLIREALKPYGYASHTLRKSRGTHLSEWGYNVYEIMNYLGHIRMETGLSYIAATQMRKKIRGDQHEQSQKNSDI